jgi:hypothetical protein
MIKIVTIAIEVPKIADVYATISLIVHDPKSMDGVIIILEFGIIP